MPVACYSLIMYLSIGFNIILFVALLAILIKYFMLKREDREFEAEIQRRLQTSVDVDRGQVGDFSIGSLEDLLAEDERRPLLQSQIIRRVPNQQTSSNASSVVSDDTFVHHRPPAYMHMKTFKPETEKQKETKDENETKV